MNYKEALQAIKEKMDYYESDKRLRAAIETLVPELRESEDERIRKELIEAFEAYDVESSWNLIPVKHILAWLEKQKEHQFCSDAPKEKSVGGDFSSSHKDKNLDEIAQDYVDGIKQYNQEPTWDLMQTAVCYGYHLGANHQVIDDEHLLSAIQVQFASHAKVENGKRYAKLTWDEFKKIVFELCSRGKQKEQQPAAWSEEDQLNLNWVIAILNGEPCDLDIQVESLIAWLKSLRPSLKPSEWQMSMLLAVINEPNNAGAESCQMALKSLYEQLKSIQ